MTSYKNFKPLVLRLSITLFIVSLTQNCNYTVPGGGFSGFEALLLGWLSFGSNSPIWAWLANPLIIMAWLTFYRLQKFSFFMSYLAFFAALSCLFIDYTYSTRETMAQLISTYSFGYWLWLASGAVIFTGNLLLFTNYKTQYVKHAAS